MPKAATITKEVILKNTFDMVRSEGFESISARNIARKIGCSTQPIYWVYKSMDELKQDVINQMKEYLTHKMTSYHKTGNPFLDMGLAYVEIAHSEPVFFKAVYIDNIFNLNESNLSPSPETIEAIRRDECGRELSESQVNELALQSWIFVHGLASLVASGILIYDEEQVLKLISNIV